ncbi:MAG TPA: hypothetical protein VL334_14410, partial [Anaerolineae bacterium]|nr:hypothetical protein [Anaerolineae bacterium]
LSCLYAYDAEAEQYIRVPALDQEYTHGLSFWKHRVIRQAVLAEQDRVDVAALGQAKRKIQQVVEAGRQRKRQHTRTRIARWDTAGKPTRQAALPAPAATAEPSSVSAPASLPAPPMTTALTLLANPEADWELCFVPRQQPGKPTTVAGAGDAV